MKLDLTDAELDELNELLAQTPEPLQPLDVVMLDGYLCGVLVQPRIVPVEQWFGPIFDTEGGTLPDDVDPAWLDRVRTLVSRRHDVMGRGLAEDGGFDPILHVDGELPDDADPALRDALRELPEHSRVLMPWVGGFQHATVSFPELLDLPDDSVGTLLARLYRHLPPETDDERELLTTMEREHPLGDLDEAIADVISTMVELYDLTEPHRLRVQTVRRDTPKVGRNDPCPCGSGKKFKHCHGA